MSFFKKTIKVEQVKVVIVGAGEVGFDIAKRLVQEQKLVIVIDSNPDKLTRFKDHLDIQTVVGSATHPSTLERADLVSANVFIAVTNSDEVNITSCLLANVINPKMMKLIRLRNEEYAIYPELFGKNALNVHTMVNPELELANTINRLLSLPAAIEYADFADAKVRMVAYRVNSGVLLAAKLTDFRLLIKNDGIIVAAISRNDKLFIPSGTDIIQDNDIVYFVYLPSSQSHLLKALGRTRAFFSTACIIGGGQIGLRLAGLFEEKKIDVKLIENDPKRCEELAELLDGTLVIQGDGTDKSLLEEENIQKMDVVVAVTADEESNILSCLLAKSMGVEDTVARVNKAAYLPLLKAIGINHSVSPRLAAVNKFLNYMRQGKVLSSATVGGDSAEIIEAEIIADSYLVDKIIKTLQLPKGILILAIIRDNLAFIPNGNSKLQANDHIVLSCTRVLVPQLEALLSQMEEE